MPKTVGVAVSNATFHFDKLYTYAVMPAQQDAVRLGSMVNENLTFPCRRSAVTSRRSARPTDCFARWATYRPSTMPAGPRSS